MLAFDIPDPVKHARMPLDASDRILIQYPIRNEPKFVIEQFFASLYTIPEQERHRFLLQVLDDYDETMNWRFESPIEVAYLKRSIRTGNKAGNLNYGLKQADKSYKWVIIYDSDHQMDGVPLIEACEILKANPIIACVQSRWVQINKSDSWLFMFQDEIITTHIEREQTFRSRWDLYPIFNGAGGLWNRETLEREAGGWVERSVCEDTDLSAIMHMKGYKIHIMPSWITKIFSVSSWVEFRKQQYRWITGNGQQIVHHLREAKLKHFLDLRFWYWISWVGGFAISPTKYIVPVVMYYKLVNHIPFNSIEYLGYLVHLPAWVASIKNHKNEWIWERIHLYPMHYILEHGVLDVQIRGFWNGVKNWNKFQEFKVTKKE